MDLRPAVVADAPALSAMLFALKAAGKRTRPCDIEFVRDYYIANAQSILCAVAFDGGEALGLQSLMRAADGNPYGAAPGYGIIGTHVSPTAARRGVARALFDATLKAARDAKLPVIEAYIQKSNAEGHAYYGAMGFAPVREDGTALVRALTL
ncbi:MAG: GNAT family N-acetyltransferase [Pseudomonadota bacterium]